MFKRLPLILCFVFAGIAIWSSTNWYAAARQRDFLQYVQDHASADPRAAVAIDRAYLDWEQQFVQELAK